MSIKKSHLDFINFLKLNNKKPSYEKNIEIKPSMNSVNLYEKNTDEEIYNWKSLFNPSIPLYKYTQIKKPAQKKIVMIDEETQKNDEDLKKFPNPVLLVDLDNKNFKKFFKKETSFREKDVNLLKCRNINNNNINKNESFYFSNFFNDYYKENLKSFIKKFPLLKPKFETNSDKLKNSLKDRKSENKERKLNDIINSDDLVIKKQELIIAGKSDNAIPLLKSIYKQTHIDYKDSNKILNKKKIKLKADYNYTNNNNRKIKIKKNNLSYIEPINEITKLECSTYNENDPDLNIFKEKYYFSSRNLNNNNNNIKNENISSVDNNLTTTISTNVSKPLIKNNLQRPLTSRVIKNNLKIINNDVRPLTTKNNDKNSNDFNNNNNNLKSIESFKNDSFSIKLNNNNNQNKKIKNNKIIKEKKNLVSEIKIEFDSFDKNKIKQRPLTNYKNNNNNIYNENNNNNQFEIKESSNKEFYNNKKEKYNYNYSNYYFNDYIDTVFKKDQIKKISDEPGYFYPLNLYNKNNQKWFSASNNIFVRNKKPFLNLNTINYNNYIKTINDNSKGLIIKPNINVLSSNRVNNKKRIYSAF